MRASLAFIAPLAAALCCSPAAVARPAALHPAGVAAERIASDGARYMAYTKVDGMTRVIDDRDRTEFEVATPPNCDNVRAIGGGQLAWSCTRPAYPWSGAAMLLDLQTRTIHEPAGLDELEQDETYRNDPGDARWYAVGSHWLLGTETTIAHSATTVSRIALNWRTGEIRHDEPVGRRVMPDPNRAGLTRKLCSPLRRQARTTPVFEDETPPFLDFQFTRPFGVAQIEHKHRGRATTYSGVLMRCGSRRRIALGPYSRETTQLGGGRVTWLGGRFAHARTLRSGAQRRWHIPFAPQMLVRTARRLYLLAGQPGEPPQLYTARLK